MIFAGILAGGVGSRMQSADVPKQFLPLDDRPVIICTLEKFLRCSRFDCIYVGVHPAWLEYLEGLLRQHLPEHTGNIRLVPGGADRNDTIFRIIQQIERTHGESDDHILVTHDAVRPFVDTRMIEENIDGAVCWGAVDTVIPASDTIVSSQDGAVISEIPDRRCMYQGQTPQSFRMAQLKRMYLSLDEIEKQTLTDACKIFVIRNQPVHLVMGSWENMKITTAHDYKIARIIAAKATAD